MYQKQFDRFEQKVWLSSPTMHGEELEYIKEAFDTNWMSTVGKNIDARRQAANMRLLYPQEQQLSTWQ